MKISFFIPEAYRLPVVGYNYNKMPASSWIRCLQLISYFQETGITITVNKLEKDANFAIFLRRWNEDDLQIAQKLKDAGTVIIADTPVNYFSDSEHPAFQGERRLGFINFAKFADRIICASENIANYAKERGYNATCIEDSIDMKMIRKDQNKSTDLIWSGTSEKAKILNSLMPVINKNGWSLTVIAKKKPDLNGDFRFIKWNYSTFPKELSKGKVGVFPRNTDNDYDRGHSFFKIGIVLASEIPVICSPVPSYVKIANANNSITLNNLNPTEWETAIQKTLSEEWQPDFTSNPIEKYSCKKIVEKYISTLQ